jgi:hypothetical protein
LLLVGCEGEPVETASVDGGADAASSDAAGPCDDIPGNVVPNWSFEKLVGDNVASWAASGLVPVTGGADHCERYAELRDLEPWRGLDERIAVSAAAGDTLEYGMSLQVLDGNYGDVGLFLLDPDDKQNSRVQRAMPKDKKWVRISGSLELTAPVTEMTIGFSSNINAPRSFVIDRVWLRVVPRSSS